MNKNGEIERKSTKGQKKVNKTRGKDKKLPAGGKTEKADDISNEFPNFSALNEEERSAFFEALAAARKNVQKRGAPIRERFGTVHDEYLQYLTREEKREDEPSEGERPLPSDPDLLREVRRERSRLVLDAGEPPEVNEKPRTPTSLSANLLRSRGEPILLERCEAVIEEDTNKILGLYYKKKKKGNEGKVDASSKKTEEPKIPKPQKKVEEKPKKKKKNENPLALKVSETPPKTRNTPRFDALNDEEKELFFKILQEARNNIVVKNPDKKKEILPMDSILRRYGEDVETSVFTTMQKPPKLCQGKKNLRVKVTLTSGDNERLLGTIPECVDEKLPKAEKAKGSEKKPPPCPEVEDLDCTGKIETEILEEDQCDANLSGHAIRKKTSCDAVEINCPTTVAKSISRELEPLIAKVIAEQSSKKKNTKKPKKQSIVKETDKTCNEQETESLVLLGNSSTSFSKPEKKKSGGEQLKNATNEENSSEKRAKGKNRAEAKKQGAEEIKCVRSNSRNVPEERRNVTPQHEENEEDQGVKETWSAKSECQESVGTLESSEGNVTCEEQSDDNLLKEEKNEECWAEQEGSVPGPSKVESEGTGFEETQCREVEEPEESREEVKGQEQKEKETEDDAHGYCESQECPSSRSFGSMSGKNSEGEVPTEECGGDVEGKREAESFIWEACRDEEAAVPEEDIGREKHSCDPVITTGKVMIVEDNVIDKIRNLIYYLEAKADSQGRLQTEYVKLVVDYVDYLSKVLEALVLKKENEQLQNDIIAAHLKFEENEHKEQKPEMRKFIPRSVSEQEFGKHQYEEEKKKQEEKLKEKESSKSDEFLPPSDSDSSLESETEIQYVPPAPANKQVLTTKIRLLQDLIKRRAEFVEGSTEDFRIVYHSQEDFVPMPKARTVKIIKEEEDSPNENNKMKFIKGIVKLCRCGKKKREEEGVYENLKGEVVRVDVTDDKRNPANVTLNESTIEVLKASGRKKIIEKYYNKQ